MTQERIFDNRSNLRGKLITESNGDKTLFDKSNNRLGYYEVRTNKSFDRSNNFVGYGISNLHSLLK